MYKPEVFECGCCGSFHPLGWIGDCRDDAHRFTYDQLEATVGPEDEGFVIVADPEEDDDN